MKIAYIYTALTTVGGADRVITEKANYFAECFGYDVYIITDSQGKEVPKFALSPKIHLINLDIMFGQQYNHSFFVRGFIYFKLMRKYKKELQKQLMKIRPDFTISTLGRDIDFITSINDGSKKIAEAHTTRKNVRNFESMMKRNIIYKFVGKIWRAKLEKTVKKFDSLVVLTNDDALEWSKVRNSILIPNSLPFYPQITSNNTNKKVISVGRFEIEKGHDRLIDVWSEVVKKNSDWILEIYGEGTLKKSLINIAKEKGLSDSILFKPSSPNISKEYIESSFCIMTSRYEGFGMVLIEAMACGLPCIAYDCPSGPRNIIREGIDGFLVTDGDTQQMAEKICFLIEHENIRKEMGQAGYSNVKKYKADEIMKKWEQLFVSLK
ncbi:Glycosyltransferase involved in cell wall bisynthesis [Bacteroides luti]|uniref:Glycosyltransferase involved in cell wall bisynthesis n=1 Tax=Bacteroides luti TaxID=1297750 RepID=A0A1M5BGN7_9BACE|nr:glycosyltransferase family 4 protein [Bacteroides luti]SHF41447.1 Glycosyltransferase involved in cell wall bisynthesis [Bacteroides luti]